MSKVESDRGHRKSQWYRQKHIAERNVLSLWNKGHRGHECPFVNGCPVLTGIVYLILYHHIYNIYIHIMLSVYIIHIK